MEHTVNFRLHKESYKDKTVTKKSFEEWMVFENTHEEMADTTTWTLAKQTQKTVRRKDTIDVANLLMGLVYCDDCGEKMDNHRGRAQAEE